MNNFDKLIKILEESATLNSETLIIQDMEKAREFVDKRDRERIAFLPVRPDWNEAKKVFGYYNVLTGLFYPTDGLNIMLNAFTSLIGDGNADKKYFIILDEMNLARVEYYFSDILSLMENMWRYTKKRILVKGETAQVHYLNRCVLSQLPNKKQYKKNEKVYQKYVHFDGNGLKWKSCSEKTCEQDCNNCIYQLLLNPETNIGDFRKRKETVNKDDFIRDFKPIPPRIVYPENLVVIGTVNIDETTFSFAPKVLDRAFVIEFSDVYFQQYLEERDVSSDFLKFIGDLQYILKVKNMHFGYRVIDEMLTYLGTHKNEDTSQYDFLLKSKVLPKLHGTDEQIAMVLNNLVRYCAKDEYREQYIDENMTVSKISTSQFDSPLNFRYPDSAKKLLQMFANMKATGYCSYF